MPLLQFSQTSVSFFADRLDRSCVGCLQLGIVSSVIHSSIIPLKHQKYEMCT